MDLPPVSFPRPTHGMCLSEQVWSSAGKGEAPASLQTSQGTRPSQERFRAVPCSQGSTFPLPHRGMFALQMPAQRGDIPPRRECFCPGSTQPSPAKNHLRVMPARQAGRGFHRHHLNLLGPWRPLCCSRNCPEMHPMRNFLGARWSVGTEGAGSAPLLLFSCSLLSSDLVAVPRGCDRTSGSHPCLAQVFNTKSKLPELLLLTPEPGLNSRLSQPPITKTANPELPKEHWHLWELWGGDAGPDLLLYVLIASLSSFLSKTPSFSGVLAHVSPPLEAQLARGGVGVEDFAVLQQVAALSNHLG